MPLAKHSIGMCEDDGEGAVATPASPTYLVLQREEASVAAMAAAASAGLSALVMGRPTTM